MNGDFLVNLDEIKEHINRAEILSLYFPFLGKTLLVDTRTSPQEGPLIRFLPMAGSIEERLWSLKKIRPNFPRPRGIVAIPWPRYARSLLQSGVWDEIARRVAALGFPEAEKDCELALVQLFQAEREEMVKAIKGEGYHTLWQAD